MQGHPCRDSGHVATGSRAISLFKSGGVADQSRSRRNTIDSHANSWPSPAAIRTVPAWARCWNVASDESGRKQSEQDQGSQSISGSDSMSIRPAYGPLGDANYVTIALGMSERNSHVGSADM